MFVVNTPNTPSTLRNSNNGDGHVNEHGYSRGGFLKPFHRISSVSSRNKKEIQTEHVHCKNDQGICNQVKLIKSTKLMVKINELSSSPHIH